MEPTATSTTVTAGQTATTAQYNNLRADARKRINVFPFQIKGAVVVQDNIANQYIVPRNMTVYRISCKTTSGQATFRLKSGSNTIASGIVATSTLSNTTSFTTSALVADELLQLDVTGISGSPEDLIINLHCTYDL